MVYKAKHVNTVFRGAETAPAFTQDVKDLKMYKEGIAAAVKYFRNQLQETDFDSFMVLVLNYVESKNYDAIAPAPSHVDHIIGINNVALLLAAIRGGTTKDDLLEGLTDYLSV